MRIGIAQSGRLHEQVEFMIAPVGVEIAGDNHRFGGLPQQIVEIPELVLPVPELQGQVDQENGDIVQLQLDDEPLDPGIEIMEAFAPDPRSGQEGIGLFAHDGHQLVYRGHAVFAFERGVMPKGPRDEIGLIHHAGADRTRVHLDETHDVRVLALDEFGDLRQYLPAGTEVAGARNRKVERGSRSGGIADVVDQKAHRNDCIDARCFAHDHRQATLAPCRVPPIPYACSLPMPGSRTTTTRVCSNISRRRGPSITRIPVSRRRNVRSTRKASAKIFAARSPPAKWWWWFRGFTSSRRNWSCFR